MVVLVQLRYAYRLDPIRFTRAARFRVLPNGRLRLPGIGDVAVRWSRELASEPSSVTVTVDAAGRLHKLSTTVVRENQLIAVEDLAVSGLARTRLARSVHDAGWSTFVAMLASKARRGGRRLVKVDRWLPSTRACSMCGAVGEAKPLHVREWTCGCGMTHDRDVNAARNILAAGRAVRPVDTTSDPGGPGQLPAKQEPTGSAA